MEPGRGATTAILVGNDQEANPTARGPMALLCIRPTSANDQRHLRPEAFPFPRRVTHSKAYEKKRQTRLYNDLQVSRPPHLGQSWVGWVGLKTQARFPTGVVLEPKMAAVQQNEVISCTCLN